jgi:hypothetical protein
VRQDTEREGIVRELLSSPLLPRLLQDAYGNYVIQSALAITTGGVHELLVEAIRPHLAALRGTPHGKRILQRIGGGMGGGGSAGAGGGGTGVPSGPGNGAR